jgi:UDP-GlcNAc:undecaprenyl-phosphate GlcNAc-1-phosphate transferase
MNLIQLNLLCYGSSLGLVILFTPIIIRLANRFGFIDRPGVRKVHRTAVPRIGGIAIALATALPFAAVVLASPSALSHSGGDVSRVATLLFASFALLALGFADDVYGVSAIYKLVVILVASSLFCASGGSIRSIVIGGHDWLDLGIFSWPVTILWLVGITVSINFIDGLDGLAAGIVAIACGVLSVAAAVGGLPLPVLLTLSLLGALSGFLIFNFHPAKLFMGDCGSMFIGFTLAASCVLCNREIGMTRSIILPALALSIPLLDTFFTMIRRGIIQRRSLFAPERGHVHHRLLESGLRHPHVVLLLYFITLLAAMVGMISFVASRWSTMILGSAFIILLFGVFRSAGTTRARETIFSIRRNRLIFREKNRFRNAFYHLQLGFREINSVDAWCEQLVRSAEALEFAKLNMALVRRDGSRTTLRWRRDERELARSDSLTAEVPVVTRRAGDSVRVEVEVEKGRFLESSGFRLALFTELIGEFGLDKIPVRPATEAVGNRATAMAAKSNLSTPGGRMDVDDADETDAARG